MFKPQQPIPDWYQQDWRPASGPRDMPQMTWEDVETVLDSLAGTPARKEAAQLMFRELRLVSAQLSPMDLLQQIILNAAAVAGPTSPRPSTRVGDRTPPGGKLPRWSYTDVEVALTYTCRGQALHIALERQRDLLRQGGLLPGAEALRSVFLIAFGLPPSRRRAASKPPEAPMKQAA